MLITVLIVSVLLILTGLMIGRYTEHREWQQRREYLQSRLRKYRKSR